MRAVVQRVKQASVRVGEDEVARIGAGLLVYLGVGRADTTEDADALAGKIAELRIFPDDVASADRFARSVLETGGEALVVSQFTLYADTRKGRRPSFTDAMEPLGAEALYEHFLKRLADRSVPTRAGIFRASMDVESINWGPVTIGLDSVKGA